MKIKVFNWKNLQKKKKRKNTRRPLGGRDFDISRTTWSEGRPGVSSGLYNRLVRCVGAVTAGRTKRRSNSYYVSGWCSPLQRKPEGVTERGEKRERGKKDKKEKEKGEKKERKQKGKRMTRERERERGWHSRNKLQHAQWKGRGNTSTWKGFK